MNLVWGGGVIIIEDLESPNPIYWAHFDKNDSMIFGQVYSNEKHSHTFRRPKLPFRVFFDTIPLSYDPNRNRILGTPPSKSIEISGDPYLDTLNIEY